MARPFPTMNPEPYDDSTPEWNLVGALFRQAVADAASRDPVRQDDIRRFLSVAGPQYWGELLGLSEGFVEAFEHALTQRTSPQRHPRP